MRMPPSVSVSRPVTSALILPRSRKIGRSRVKASAMTPPKAASSTSVAVVSCQLSQNSTPSAIDAGDDAADQLHEAVADQVPDALGVVHDARDQHAGLGRVEVADRQPRDVLLDGAAHVGDRPLRGDAQHLRQRKAGDGLHQRRRAGGQRQRPQQVGARLADDVVDQQLRGRGQHQAGQPADHHQRHAERPGGRGAPR